MFEECFLHGALGLSLAMLSVAASAGVFTSLTVFGDDLSDEGNDFLYTAGAWPPAPYLQRLCNGPVAVEQLASNLGLALQDLYSDGARTILMPNLLDLGLTPWVWAEPTRQR